MTSAYLALQLFLGEFEHVVVPFDQIFDTVKSGRTAAGLIIHEGQLTYAAAGFNRLLDLGAWWKEKSSLPLPLGGNVVRKDLRPEVRRDLRRSSVRASTTGWLIARRRCAIRFLMRATWMRCSPANSSACM
jgi:Predicted periplasmic solute-binding protein